MRLSTIYLICIVGSASSAYFKLYNLAYIFAGIAVVATIVKFAFSKPKVVRKHISQKTKDEVLRRQGGRCNRFLCFKKDNLQLHHRIPKHRGGDDSTFNLEYLCPNHHAKIHELMRY